MASCVCSCSWRKALSVSWAWHGYGQSGSISRCQRPCALPLRWVRSAGYRLRLDSRRGVRTGSSPLTGAASVTFARQVDEGFAPLLGGPDMLRRRDLDSCTATEHCRARIQLASNGHSSIHKQTLEMQSFSESFSAPEWIPALNRIRIFPRCLCALAASSRSRSWCGL